MLVTHTAGCLRVVRPGGPLGKLDDEKREVCEVVNCCHNFMVLEMETVSQTPARICSCDKIWYVRHLLEYAVASSYD